MQEVKIEKKADTQTMAVRIGILEVGKRYISSD
jgi:hypothetical protein